MPGQFLIPRQIVEANGTGPAVALATTAGSMLQLTLEVLHSVEQQSLEIRIEGSVDGSAWEEKPLAGFSQKFYSGAWVIVCDLTGRPEIQSIRASWKVNRWGRGSLKPRFELYLFAESFASVALDSK